MGFRDAWNSVFDMLFRLFPHRSPPGLIAVGHPGPDAPVLLTGNYTLTVRRLKRALAGEDAWLLSADSKGINVWCAAGGGHLTHHDVIAAIRTSGVGERVARHRLILPQLSATGVERRHITAATGWEALWGPARLEDLPAYLHRGGEVHRRERLMRFPLRERMEMAFMWVWPIVALGAPAVAWLANGPIALAFALMAPALVFGLFAALPRLRVSGRARWLTFAAAAACGFAGGAALLAVLGALSAGGLVWMAGVRCW